MSKNLKRYRVLSKHDFQNISRETNYSVEYVRKVVRGYVKPNARNEIILQFAEKELKLILKQINNEEKNN